MRLHGRLRLALGALALLGAAGCGTLADVFSGGGGAPMLQGHDPVSYYTIGRPVKCVDTIKVEHQGASYCFANDANRRMFITSPARFVPQFGGFCALAATYSLPVAADPLVFKIIDGKLHLFATTRNKSYFEMDQERNLTLAQYYWETEIRDSNEHYQYLKRLIFRVPHYRSDAQLADEYERRFGKKPG